MLLNPRILPRKKLFVIRIRLDQERLALLEFPVLEPNGNSKTRHIILVADAKYKPRVDTGDLERMLAYMLAYYWDTPKETARGLFLFTGSNGKDFKIFRQRRRGQMPAVEIYSSCMKPCNMESFAEHKLREVMLKILLEHHILNALNGYSSQGDS